MEDTRAALADYYRKEKPKLIGFIRKLFRNTPDREAEDILQDVMAFILDGPDFSAPIGNIGGYLYRSIRNRVIDIYRGHKKLVSLDTIADAANGFTLAEILPDKRTDTHRSVVSRETADRIYRAVDRLKPDQKAVWIATEIEGYSFEDLSVIWQTPLGTLLARKHRAVRKLRRQLKDLMEP